MAAAGLGEWAAGKVRANRWWGRGLALGCKPGRCFGSASTDCLNCGQRPALLPAIQGWIESWVEALCRLAAREPGWRFGGVQLGDPAAKSHSRSSPQPAAAVVIVAGAGLAEPEFSCPART